jgi:hypoxanthine phosphoribosyltransferase
MARVPLFDGGVTPGRRYIIVDDVCTTGSSLAALRHYIEARGSRVVLATALAVPEPAYGHDARQLAITRVTIEKIQKKFDSAVLDVILHEYGVAPSIHHLTEAAGRTILGFETTHGIRSCLTAAR